MNKYNTKLGQMLSLIDKSQFGKLVKLTESDKHCELQQQEQVFHPLYVRTRRLHF